MPTITASAESSIRFGADLAVDKMPAHWLMARLGKRVLRPGGVAMTRWMLGRAGIGAADRVIELAPGLGATAREILARGPASYVGVERDACAAKRCEAELRDAGFTDARVLRGDASRVPLPDASATLVLGEALLSMQPEGRKRDILREVRRLLRPGGRYAIHELAVTPESIEDADLSRVEADLSRAIHVGVRIGTVSEWKTRLAEEGLIVESTAVAPMRLLEVDQLVRDEGLAGAAWFVVKALRTPGAAERLIDVRAAFRKHAAHLCAFALVAHNPSPEEVSHGH